MKKRRERRMACCWFVPLLIMGSDRGRLPGFVRSATGPRPKGAPPLQCMSMPGIASSGVASEGPPTFSASLCPSSAGHVSRFVGLVPSSETCLPSRHSKICPCTCNPFPNLRGFRTGRLYVCLDCIRVCRSVFIPFRWGVRPPQIRANVPAEQLHAIRISAHVTSDLTRGLSRPVNPACDMLAADYGRRPHVHNP